MKKSNNIVLAILVTAGVGTASYINYSSNNCGPAYNNTGCSSSGSSAGFGRSSSEQSVTRGGFGHGSFGHSGS